MVSCCCVDTHTASKAGLISFALAFNRGNRALGDCAAETQRVLVVQRQHDGRLFCTALCHLGHNSSGRQRIAALRVMKNLALTGVSSLHQCARSRSLAPSLPQLTVCLCADLGVVALAAEQGLVKWLMEDASLLQSSDEVGHTAPLATQCAALCLDILVNMSAHGTGPEDSTNTNLLQPACLFGCLLAC